MNFLWDSIFSVIHPLKVQFQGRMSILMTSRINNNIFSLHVWNFAPGWISDFSVIPLQIVIRTFFSSYQANTTKFNPWPRNVSGSWNVNDRTARLWENVTVRSARSRETGWKIRTPTQKSWPSNTVFSLYPLFGKLENSSNFFTSLNQTTKKIIRKCSVIWFQPVQFSSRFRLGAQVANSSSTSL